MSERLGQHFLKNDRAIRTIVDALEIKPEETIVEIGPGRGALTIPLQKICEKNKCKLIAVEKDELLATELKKRFSENKNISIITGDIRKLLSEIANDEKNWKLVGNIPYYLTGHLLRIVSELESKPALIVLTVQKEVAERIVAAPPKINLLAAILQSWTDTKMIMVIPRGSFDPSPEVDSAVIRLMPKENQQELKKYFDFVKQVFRQPRKTIQNNLKSAGYSNEAIQRALQNSHIDGIKRPQNLSIEALMALEKAFGK